MSKKTLLTLFLGSLLTVAGFAASVVRAETIRLVTHEYKPYSWADKDGKMTGLTVEIANLLFEQAGIDKTWKMMPSKRAYNYAKKTPNTCIFPLQRNQEREADFRWISPIMINRYAFYTPKGRQQNIRTLTDLKDMKVVTYLGSGLREYLEGFGINTIEAMRDDIAANMVAIGRIDVWATDEFSMPYTTKDTGLEFDQKFVFFTSIGAMACHSSMSEEIINRLQTELSKLYQTLEIAKIVRRYEL